MRWAALDGVLAGLRAAPSRTGSVIATVYGDAILPRGGALALADLLVLMERLGAAEGVVRTAVSRMARDGVLEGRRRGRRSAYALTAAAAAAFQVAGTRIYGRDERIWDGRLRLAFPEVGADRGALDAAGFAVMAPGVLVSPWETPDEGVWLEACGPDGMARQLAARAWPLERLGEQYSVFVAMFGALLPVPAVEPLDAVAARIMTVHAWRRMALRDPCLPAGLLPKDWPGGPARELCMAVYAGVAEASEAWLDRASNGRGMLPVGGRPLDRFRS